MAQLGKLGRIRGELFQQVAGSTLPNVKLPGSSRHTLSKALCDESTDFRSLQAGMATSRLSAYEGQQGREAPVGKGASRCPARS